MRLWAAAASHRGDDGDDDDDDMTDKMKKKLKGQKLKFACKMSERLDDERTDRRCLESCKVKGF